MSKFTFPDGNAIFFKIPFLKILSFVIFETSCWCEFFIKQVFCLAPGTYDTDKAYDMLEKDAAYSFGIKTQGPRPDNVPGK